MTLAPEFAQALRHNRSHCNLRVKEAYHLNNQLDPADFSVFLQHQLNPVVAAVASYNLDQVNNVVLEGFDIGLELVAKKLAGPNARHPWINTAWQQCAPLYAHLIAQDATTFLGSVTNALIHVEALTGERVGQWITYMSAVAQQVQTIEQFQQIGYICAWRCGFAHTRSTALAVANQLPEKLALMAVGATENWNDIYKKLLHDRWWSPNSQLTTQHHHLGNYTGFGGLFISIPEVRSTDQGFVVASAENYYFLQADCYGAVLLPTTKTEFEQGLPAVSFKPYPLLDRRDFYSAAKDFGFPEGSLRTVYNQHSIVLFSESSYMLHILPNQPHDR